MNRILLITFFIAYSVLSWGQTAVVSVLDSMEKSTSVNPDSLLAIGDPNGAALEFKKTYYHDPAGLLNAYKVAEAYGYARQPDSAFKYLFLSLRSDTTIMACTSPAFLNLRTDPRWTNFVDSAVGIVTYAYPGIITDWELARKLWDMHAWDQAYYYEIDIAERALGIDSPVASAFWNLKEEINKRNVLRLDSIIKIKGWPTMTTVGHYGSQAAFLVVQHSNVELQNKYLPIIKVHCEKGEVSWESYALMYDRVQVTEGRPQLYGTQVRWNETINGNEFFPIEDEKNVNSRRAKMGLEPIEDYASHFEIDYVPK